MEREGERYSRRPTDLMPLNYVFPSLDPRKFVWPLLKLWRIITWNWLMHRDPATQTFNTLTPVRLGEGAMKCSFRFVPGPLGWLSGTYREKLRQRLAAGPIDYDFLVQRRTMPDREPLDDATKVWKSPLMRVGSLRILPQDFETEERIGMEERVSYSPYNALKAHEPLGSLNEVRKWAYRHSGIKRAAMCPFHTPKDE